jgi:lipid-A-disaccharide synthase
MCVFYRLSNITYLIAKILVKTKFISLVNIVLNKEAVKEFVQKDASSKSISDELIKIKRIISYRKKMIISDYEILKKNFQMILQKKILSM